MRKYSQTENILPTKVILIPLSKQNHSSLVYFLLVFFNAHLSFRHLFSKYLYNFVLYYCITNILSCCYLIFTTNYELLIVMDVYWLFMNNSQWSKLIYLGVQLHTKSVKAFWAFSCGSKSVLFSPYIPSGHDLVPHFPNNCFFPECSLYFTTLLKNKHKSREHNYPGVIKYYKTECCHNCP